MEDGSTKSIMVYNEYDGVYKKILIRNNKLLELCFMGIQKIVQAISDVDEKRRH